MKKRSSVSIVFEEQRKLFKRYASRVYWLLFGAIAIVIGLNERVSGSTPFSVLQTVLTMIVVWTILTYWKSLLTVTKQTFIALRAKAGTHDVISNGNCSIRRSVSVDVEPAYKKFWKHL